MTYELVVATPAFLDLTVVGLEGLPGLGEERFAGDLVRSPGGGAITAVAAARLGLRAALAAPLGDDLAGEWVRAEVEKEGVKVCGPRQRRTAQTLVLPIGEERAMVTIDPGARARRADVAELRPQAVAANLEQLALVPDGARAYVTCGDDDARAYKGRLPARLGEARALFLDTADALLLTGADSVEAAAEQLTEHVDTVMIALGTRGALTLRAGRRIETPDFDTGPVVDTTGDRDLLCAAYAWADLRGADPDACLAWAQLYSRLAMTVPTATGGAVDLARLLETGTRHGLVPPPGASSTAHATA